MSAFNSTYEKKGTKLGPQRDSPNLFFPLSWVYQLMNDGVIMGSELASPASPQHWTRLPCDDRMASGPTPKETYDASPGTDPESGAGTQKPQS